MKKLSQEDTKFAYNFLADREAYHHHKEQMAYIGFLVQTAFFTAIMTFNWASSSPSTTNMPPEFLLILAVPFWAFVHLFVRWQLRLRRYAALQVAALLSALLNNLSGSREETTGDGNSAGRENATDKTGSRWRKGFRWLLDWSFWPCPSAFPYADVDVSKFPSWYQEEFRSAISKGTGAVLGERLVTWGSGLILIGIIIRLTVLS